MIPHSNTVCHVSPSLCLLALPSIYLDTISNGFRQNTDPRSTDPLLTPLLTPYKIDGKLKIKKPRTINGTRFKFINKFSLPETCKMADALQISDSCSPFTVQWRFLLTENRPQNKIEYHQIMLSYALENEVKRNADK